MRWLTLLFLVLALSSLALAADQPAKPAPTTTPSSPDPAVIRQGGDTIETGTVITEYPYFNTGTTTGYTDDYDEACPYEGSTSPDVVYLFTPEWAECYRFDLYGSTYDTKIYIYDDEQNLIACNDDFYPDYVSLIETSWLVPGQTYAVVIDGYGGTHGDYELRMDNFAACHVECHDNTVDEGEPPLEDGVPDTYNSGCDGSTTDPAIVALQGDTTGFLPLCGRMGWITIDDEVVQDIDWFRVTVGATGEIEGLGDAAPLVNVTVFEPGGCDGMQFVQQFVLGPCYEQEFTITGEPGQEYLLRVAMPITPAPCGGETPAEVEYLVYFHGLQGTVGVEARSLSGVKGLYR